MKAYLDQMERLDYPMPLVLGVNLILTSLSKDYDKFVQNYNMYGMGKTIPELHAMLKLAEKCIPKKAPAVLAIRQAYDLRHKIPPPAKKEHPAKDTEFHYCHKLGHWKSNFPLYLAGLKKNKANMSSTSGTFGLYVGNGNRAAVEAIGSFDLILPSVMVLVLDNCHFSPSITRGVISLSCLCDNGFLHKFTNNGAISVSKDNVFYFNVIPRYGIFEIDMQNHVSNERSIYSCSNKKSKHNLDSTFLWHCHLGHINKKRVAKLQHDGLLKSIDDESFDVCISCLSGKMVRKPFTHASERADDLLGIIHSDGYALEFAVCILNMVPTKKIDKTPYGIWHGSIKCIFVGYPKEMLGYYFYYPPENKIFVARYAEFFESNIISQEASGSTVDFDDIQRQDAQPSENTSEHRPEVEHEDVETQTHVILVSKSVRIPQVPKRYGFYVDAEELVGDHGELANYRDALSNPESDKWLEAMNAEMQSMKDNQVWNLVDLPFNYTKSIRILKRIMTMRFGIYEYASFKDPFMDLSELLGAETRDLMRRSKSMVSLKIPISHVYIRELVEVSFFLILYVDDILLMGNNIPMLQDVKSWIGKCFAMKDLALSKTQGPFTPAEVMRMKGVHYASDIGSIMYAVRVCLRDERRRFDWKSSKQSTIAMSSMKAEYIAASKAAMEAIWIHKFISRLGVVPNNDRPMDMYCDSTGAITIADEPSVQKDNNLVDPFTKPMSCSKHVEHARNIGLRPAVSFM
ncbi:retrotransposon protein, putative, ty1-copia subclass [Tanacetum coccineum]|uniref:Retrotransposon protein, putative, ty1-copia subclass n=1 Tax=Tanacetum coccineum TaxID=301880 RepID=A0ABQ5DWF4_9ASTR